jgi:predicted nucleotidyltransferase
MAATKTNSAKRVIFTLRPHEPRAAGIRLLSLFASLARGDADDASDVDIVAELDPAARIGLFALTWRRLMRTPIGASLWV